MVAPALVNISQEFGIKSDIEQTLVLSVFILAYAVGPLFLGPLSELFGRVMVLQIANGFFIVFNLACGFAQNSAQMIAFRFLAGLGGSAPLSIGGGKKDNERRDNSVSLTLTTLSGTLGDCWQPHERGKAIAIYSMMPLLGPAIGPIAGGFITQHTTWRWAFWATSLAAGTIQLCGIFLLQETYAPELLRRKKILLAKKTHNPNLRTEYDNPSRTLTSHMRNALVRPFRLITTQPIIQVLALYIAAVYGYMCLVIASFPKLWTSDAYYSQSTSRAGLNYLSLGVGFFVGTQVCAPFNDRIYKYLKKRNGGVGRSEFRVPLMVPGSLIMPVGLFWYGWCAETRQHWVWPNLGAAVYAAGSVIIFQCVQVRNPAPHEFLTICGPMMHNLSVVTTTAQTNSSRHRLTS